MIFLLVVLPAGIAFGWEGVAVRIIDGDSLQVQRDGKMVEIRLYGIDAPEYRQPYSNLAKQFAKRFALGKVVTVRKKDVDRYARLVALVEVGGKMLNRELVRQGLAWFYPRYCLEQPLCGELQRLEQKARTEKRGLWKDEDPISPWDWKHGHKKDGAHQKKTWFQRLSDWL